jgi:hypothetical protein
MKNQKSSKELHLHNPSRKWCIFTYIGTETLFITKIFKQANLQIAYHTNNTLQKYLSYNNNQQDKFKQSGIYKLTCLAATKHILDREAMLFTLDTMNTREPSNTTPNIQNSLNILQNTDTPSGI